MGAGVSEGTILDVSNIIKPTGKGELNCIAATTITEYRRYVERDHALVRRFQKVRVEEPSSEETLNILRGSRMDYQKHYNAQISDEALKSAVNLSTRYLHSKKLPDKALDVLDDGATKSIHKNDHNSQNNSLVDVTVNDVVKVVEQKSGVPVKLDSHERNQILQLDERLRELVVGQDEAIKSISKRLKIARAGLKDPKRPFEFSLF